MIKNSRRGVVLVISSPSGAGKTTICKKIIEQTDNVSLSVSITTKKKKKGEIEGKDYYFKTDQEFFSMIKNNDFIENAKVFGNFYGTLKREVLQKIEGGIDVLVDIDWQGTRQIQEYIPDDIVKVFILPPSIKELELRLGNRASENQKDFNKRMSEARKEISHYNEYNFVIINDKIDVAVNSIKSILYSERLRKSRQTSLLNIINNLI